MYFIEHKVEILSLGPSYKDVQVHVYTTSDGEIYKQMGLAWFNAEGERLLGDISHLSKAADDLNESRKCDGG